MPSRLMEPCAWPRLVMKHLPNALEKNGFSHTLLKGSGGGSSAQKAGGWHLDAAIQVEFMHRLDQLALPLVIRNIL